MNKKNSLPADILFYATGDGLWPKGIMRTEGSNGIIYDSVRETGGECVAIFKPPVISNCVQERHLNYIWNGEKFTDVTEIKTLKTDL